MYAAKSSLVTERPSQSKATPDTQGQLERCREGSGAPRPSFSWRLLSDLLHVFLPHPCLACREPISLPSPKTPQPKLELGLCHACHQLLQPEPEPCCLQCGDALPEDDVAEARHIQTTSSTPQLSAPAALCTPCNTSSVPIQRCLSVWSYQPPLDAVMKGLKFQHLPYLAHSLGEAVARHLGARLEDLGPIDAVVPVPLHWRRRLQRGFDQAHLLAKVVAQGLGAPLRPVLRRHRATPAQSRLSREARQRNLARAFTWKAWRRPWPRDAHVLLLDDVVTTGATLMAAAEVLQASSPCRITAVTVARTPSHAPPILKLRSSPPSPQTTETP